jgi:hypothetical protein
MPCTCTQVSPGISACKRSSCHTPICHIVGEIIRRREELGKSFSPDTDLAIRAACPVSECGLADKHGTCNVYEDTAIRFHCPRHGEYSVYNTTSSGVSCLEFNTTLCNLLRALLYPCDMDSLSHWCRLRRLLPRAAALAAHVPRHPCSSIPHSSLIGLVQNSQRVCMSVRVLTSTLSRRSSITCCHLESSGSRANICRWSFNEVRECRDHPHMLFRSYSIHYLANLFTGKTAS